MPLPEYFVVIAAAGKSERFGGKNKLLARVLGKPLLSYTIERVRKSSAKGFVLVSNSDFEDEYKSIAAQYGGEKFIKAVTGGATRRMSVINGLEALAGFASGDSIVLIHDGARPLCPPELFDLCAEKAQQSDAAVVAIPVADTLKAVDNGKIVSTVERSNLWRAQTPQGFKLDVILKALKQAPDSITDDSQAVEAMGIKPVIVRGTAQNIKITYPEDIKIFEALLRLLT